MVTERPTRVTENIPGGITLASSATLLPNNKEKQPKTRGKGRFKAKANGKAKAATLTKDGVVSRLIFLEKIGGIGVGGEAHSSTDGIGCSLRCEMKATNSRR